LKVFQIGDFKALHLQLTESSLSLVRTNPHIQIIEENSIVTLKQEPACTEQSNVIWNLDRVNNRDINEGDDNYLYSWAGENVDVYIVDTGVLTTHEEFKDGRAIWGDNFADSIDSDCNGHGTHVAGTIGGIQYGLAKKTTLIAVKVLGCSGSGTWDGVISGIQYTADSAKQRNKPSVANMSLGGGFMAAVNQAVAAAVKAGVTFAVAAGNENTDACSRSPASEPTAITVAATTVVQAPTGNQKDQRASFSNFGTCVDIAAPGQLIKAAWIDLRGFPPGTSYNTISGTSMASPHVAGAAAIVLSASPSLTPAEVEETLLDITTDGVIDFACSGRPVCLQTPNKLLYTNCAE